METCETCGKTAPAAKHPCRFERACKCWYGTPCKSGENMRVKAS